MRVDHTSQPLQVESLHDVQACQPKHIPSAAQRRTRRTAAGRGGPRGHSGGRLALADAVGGGQNLACGRPLRHHRHGARPPSLVGLVVGRPAGPRGRPYGVQPCRRPFLGPAGDGGAGASPRAAGAGCFWGLGGGLCLGRCTPWGFGGCRVACLRGAWRGAVPGPWGFGLRACLRSLLSPLRTVAPSVVS